MSKTNIITMIRINRIQTKELFYYECTFDGGNLFAYTITDLVSQLTSIYGFKLSLFTFNNN